MHKCVIFLVFISCTYFIFGNIKLYGQTDVNVQHQFDANSWHQFDVDSSHPKNFHFWPMINCQFTSAVDIILMSIQHFFAHWDITYTWWPIELHCLYKHITYIWWPTQLKWLHQYVTYTWWPTQLKSLHQYITYTWWHTRLHSLYQ